METFLDLYLTRQGIEKGVVVSAKPLTTAALDKVHTLAERISGKKVLLEKKTNPALLGGFVLRIGDHELDQSVAARLERVRRKLKTSA
jgi:F-type H+-transporting ATPase subunit delta